MPTGYCTVDDVRRVFQKAGFSGALASADNQIVVDAITSLTAPVEKATKRHWYAETRPDEDTHALLPTSAKTRDDEHDIPTNGGMVHGASERDRYRFRKNSDALLESGPRYDRRRKHRREPKRDIRLVFGALHDESVPAYTRLRLNRKDVVAINDLHVVNGAGGFDDWTANLEGGVGNTHRGEDYWVRINNGGVAELYLDVHAMDDDLASLSNAVYVDLDYGHAGLPQNVRRGVAMLAASELVLDDEFVVSIPDDGQLTNVETKAQRWQRLGVQKLQPHIEDEDLLGVDV